MKLKTAIFASVSLIYGLSSCTVHYESAGAGSGNDNYATDPNQYTNNACAVNDTNRPCYFLVRAKDIKNYWPDMASDLRLYACKTGVNKTGYAIVSQPSRSSLDLDKVLFSASGNTCPVDCWVGTTEMRASAPENVTANSARPMITEYADAAPADAVKQIKLPREVIRVELAMSDCVYLQIFPVRIGDEDKVLVIPVSGTGSVAGNIYYVLDATNRCPIDCLTF